MTINIEETLPEDTLGQRLRKARMAKGLTIKAVAAMAGIDPHTLSAWERDKYKARVGPKTNRVAKILGLDVRCFEQKKTPHKSDQGAQ